MCMYVCMYVYVTPTFLKSILAVDSPFQAKKFAELENSEASDRYRNHKTDTGYVSVHEEEKKLRP